jgi:hypothetical protein
VTPSRAAILHGVGFGVARTNPANGWRISDVDLRLPAPATRVAVRLGAHALLFTRGGRPGAPARRWTFRQPNVLLNRHGGLRIVATPTYAGTRLTPRIAFADGAERSVTVDVAHDPGVNLSAGGS